VTISRAARLAVASLLLVVAAAPGAAAGSAAVLHTRAGEFQPARSARFLAWERNTPARPGHYDVFVRSRPGRRIKVNSPGTMGANGGIDGRRLVYQQWRKGDSDIRIFDLRRRKRGYPPRGVNTPRWEYWPSISGRWILFGRRLPGGARRVILYDRRSRRVRTLARTSGPRQFAAPGQVSGRWAVWWKCTPATGCNVFRYDIRSKRRLRAPNPGRYQRAPSVTPQGTVYFVRSGDRCGRSAKIMRYFPGARPKVLVELREGVTSSDTYAHSGRRGPTRLFYERNRCGDPAASDIWRLRDPRFLALRVARRAAGGGTVTTSRRGITCGSDCLHAYRAGSSVTLTATPEKDSNFTGWGGACSGRAPTCTVSMKRALHVVAFFDPATSFALSVAKRGTGRGRITSRPSGIDCGSDCWEAYRAGTSVTLRARPANGSAFVRWRGACSGTGRCRLTIDRVRAVVAVFRRSTATRSWPLPALVGGGA
jgi:hypothetical protein